MMLHYVKNEYKHVEGRLKACHISMSGPDSHVHLVIISNVCATILQEYTSNHERRQGVGVCEQWPRKISYWPPHAVSH
jgi:hypothetical protein